jgi:hypothetical protein
MNPHLDRTLLESALLVVLAMTAPSAVGAAAAQEHPTRLVLMSVRIPSRIQAHDPAQRFLDSLIQDRLLGAGYQVVPPDSVEPLWQQALDSAGPAFDPVTGQEDTTKGDVARQAMMDQARTRFAADYLVAPFVGVVKVKFKGSKAKWDGVEEKTGGPGMFSWSHDPYVGTLPGLTLFIPVIDFQDSLRYEGRGGVQLASKISGSDLQAVSMTMLLIDFTLLADATRIALEKLGSKVPPMTRP